MNFDNQIHIGIVNAPAYPPSVADMQTIIEGAANESHLIQQCLLYAEHGNMTPEDKYAFLAYHALVQLETSFQRCQELVRLLPLPPLVPVSYPA